MGLCSERNSVGASNIVLLTLLGGGGVFGNESVWII